MSDDERDIDIESDVSLTRHTIHSTEDEFKKKLIRHSSEKCLRQTHFFINFFEFSKTICRMTAIPMG